MRTKQFAVSFLFLSLCLNVWIASNCLATTRNTRHFTNEGQPHGRTPQTRESTVLRLADPLTREIARGQTESFEITLADGEYALVEITWQGIDLTASVYDPTGIGVLPASVLIAPGPVLITIGAGKPGFYKLEVTTPVRQKISGRFRIELAAVRPPTLADRSRVRAQNLVAQGRSEKRPSEAIAKYNGALVEWQRAQDIDGEARTMMLLGDTFRAIPNLSDAKASYERAAQLWHSTGHLRGVAHAKISVGAMFRTSGPAREALLYYSEARNLFSQARDRGGEASALFGEALTHMTIGQTSLALDALHPALEIRRTEGDRLGQASTLNVMADAYRQLGDPDKSLSLYDQTSEVLEGLEHRSLEAIVLNGRAVVYDDLGDWQRAQDGYSRALSMHELLLGSPGLASCSPRPAAAIANVCRSAATTIDNLGETYNSLGNPARALQEFSRSLIIRDALGQARGQGLTRFHIGYAHFLLGDSEKAIENYQTALRFQQAAEDEKGTALTLTYWGMAHVARNDPASALKLYKNALPLQKASGDKRALAITLDKLAYAHGLLGSSEEASSNYKQALEIWRAIKDPDGEALTLYNLAHAERESGNLTTASQLMEATLRLVESLRLRITSERHRISYLANKENYYELDIDLKMQLGKAGNDGNYVAAALESFEKSRARVLLDALSEVGLERGDLNQRSNPELAKLLADRQELLGQLRAKLQARTKSLSAAQITPPTTVFDTEIGRLTDQLDQMDEKIRVSNPRLATLTKAQPSSIAEIQQQLDDDTLLLEYSLGDKRSYVWVVSPHSIKGFELAGREKIETVAHRVATSLTERNRELKDEPWARRQLRLRIAAGEYETAAAELGRMVIDPVASLLGRKRLVVVADGALQTVPFSALPLPSVTAIIDENDNSAKANAASIGSHTLVARHEIISLPSASVLALQRRELANRKPAPYAVAVIADPVFDVEDTRVAKAKGVSGRDRKEVAGESGETGSQEKPAQSAPATALAANSALASALRDVGLTEGNLPRLTSSRGEALAITRSAAPRRSFSALDFQANRETATSPELSKYRIIHFATHGILDLEHPELSGIVLSRVDKKGQILDGYVRLHDIYNLNLPAELIVLSACQTGVGKRVKGEGLIALTRGFMYAGARSVVASFWKVDDTATSALMAEFYRQMFVHQLKPAAALRQAQLKISQQKRWESPYYWAGFFLQGDWK